MRRQPLVVIGVSLCVLVIAMTVAASMSQTRDERMQTTTFSTSPTGTRAIFETLRNADVDVRRWRRPYDQIPEDATVFIVAGPDQPIGARAWRDTIRPWVSNGGTLLLATGAGVAFPVYWEGDREIAKELQYESTTNRWWNSDDDTEGDTTENDHASQDSLSFQDEYEKYAETLKGKATVRAIVQSPITGPAAVLTVDPSFGVACDYGNAIPLFADDDEIYAWYIPVRQGRIILTATPGWLMNRRVAEPGNLEFLLGILEAYGRDGAVLFDERSHGYGLGDRQISDLWRTAAWGFALAHVAVLAVWFAATNGRRFGPRLLLNYDTPRSTMEYVDAMGNLYRRAEMQHDALQAEWVRFRTGVAKRYGIDPKEKAVRLVERLSAVSPVSAYTAESTVRTVGKALRQGWLDDGELVHASQALAELRNEVL